MTNFRSVLEVTRPEWLAGLQLSESDVPDAVIVEGSWWREQRQAWRLDYLSDVRELGFPDLYWGRWKDTKIVFCMAYGAPRAVEVVYLFALLGTELAIQIGTCGGLQSELAPGDIVIPDQVTGEDGVAHLFGSGSTTAATPHLMTLAAEALRGRDQKVFVGKHMTFSSLFAESVEMMEAWHASGYLSVDMETATTLSVAEHFNRSAVSLLVVWDELTRGRRFMDPMDDEDLAALEKGNKDVFEVALDLVVAQSQRSRKVSDG